MSTRKVTSVWLHSNSSKISGRTPKSPRSPVTGAVSQVRVSEGSNGAAYKIVFPDKISILKLTKGRDRDSLVYEYLVGKKINKWYSLFPVFVYTNGIYYFKDKSKKNAELENVDLSKLKLFHPSLTNGCRTAGIQALLIDFIDGKSLKTFMTNPEFNTHDLAYVLFQIYYALVHLRESFTHYDLHASNVLVYEPFPGHAVQYTYHIGANVVTFRTRYAPKIIDYGRSHIKNFDFSGLKKDACNTRRCGFWGIKCGFYHYHTTYSNIKNRNVSQDLRLLKNLPAPLESISSRIHFGETLPEARAKYSTLEIESMGFPARINNVMDALRAIMEKLPSNNLPFDYQVEVFGDKPFTTKKVGDPDSVYMSANRSSSYFSAN